MTAKSGPIGIRLYELLLRLYPAAYRRSFGSQMLQTFEDYYKDAGNSRHSIAILFWLTVLIDEAKGILREHLAASGGERVSMRASDRTLMVLILLFVGLLWFLLALGGRVLIFLVRLAPALLLALLLIYLLRRMLDAFPVPAKLSRRGWLGYALILSALWLAMEVTWQLIQMFGPTLQGANFLGMNDPFGVVMLLGEPVLFGALGLISSYTSGQRRSGVYAGVLAAAILWLVGTGIAVGLILLTWPIFQHMLIHSDWGMDYLNSPKARASVWSFVNSELFDFGPDLGWLGFLTNVLWATFGALMGVSASSRAADQPKSSIWRDRQVRILSAGWVLALALLLAFGPHKSYDTVFSPAPMMLQVLRFSAGPVAWLAVLAVVLTLMRKAGSPPRSVGQ